MKGPELLKEFIRVEKAERRVHILVCEIGWDGPHTPISRWVISRSLTHEASETEVEEAIAGILEDPRYFRVCLECGERQPLGWMHDERVCQGCAETNHGVAH